MKFTETKESVRTGKDQIFCLKGTDIKGKEMILLNLKLISSSVFTDFKEVLINAKVIYI